MIEVAGHEISGRVVAAGAGTETWQGKAVIVPSVIPCGECELCISGHGTIFRRQQMPGNDIQGGGATHIRVPSRGLCFVDALADDPSQAALSYFEEHLAKRSASSLRFAVRAARFDLVARVRRKLAEVERLYLEELMATYDAVEGLAAFIAKRPPAWEDR